MLLTLAMLGLFCWLLAQWIWYFLEPSAAPQRVQPQAATGIMFNPAQVAGLFGVAGSSATQTQQVVVPTTLNVQLKGVFAENGDALDYAILNLEGREQGFRVGDQLMPGVVLQSVAPGHVVLMRGTVAEKVIFADANANPGIAAGPTPRVAAPQPGNQFRLNVRPVAPNVRAFSRNELNTALGDSAQLSNLGRVGAAAGGGVVMEDVPAGSLAAHLGLQLGDVVKDINGQPVNTPADLMRLYQEFDSTDHITVGGIRNGRPLQLTFNVQQ